jgi:hypothetical protein
MMAANYGMTHYIDYDFADEEGLLDGYSVGDNVAEVLADVGFLEGTLSGTEDLVVLINKTGPGGGFPVIRLYGDSSLIRTYAAALGEMEGDAPRTDLIQRLKVSRRYMDT